jgi:sporulation protein YlmC with PRC-barrel domain
MKRSLKEILGYTVEAQDGTNGTVKDFLFDEKNWIIRYLEADLGKIFSGRKVLIPKMSLQEPDWAHQQFLVKLTKSDIEKCPELSENLPISTKYEQKLNKHYKLDDYWSSISVPASQSGFTVNHPGRPRIKPIKNCDPSGGIREKNIDSTLRSLNELKGYHIQAFDGKLGHIDDVIIDDEDWRIVYIIVDTSNWMPWSRKVLIGNTWIDEISYVNQQVKINLHIDSIKSAPRFDPLEPVNVEYEKQLYDFYGRSVKKKK